ncbi:hypothetical protein EJ08DRAFT_649605 [Tothia fuscella]|uniref:Uncharacterized protein n=1 Tax=Tothia fuscella TaxID=1048955 RepID=A0A9P4TYG1_9PEZI|nr:hypothetical protein EJ08DRAFT_649605 [Tothia fuscella]
MYRRHSVKWVEPYRREMIRTRIYHWTKPVQYQLLGSISGLNIVISAFPWQATYRNKFGVAFGV